MQIKVGAKYNQRANPNTSWQTKKDSKIFVHRIKNHNHLSHSNSHRMSKWRIITGSSDVNEISYLASIKPNWFSSTPTMSINVGSWVFNLQQFHNPKNNQLYIHAIWLYLKVIWMKLEYRQTNCSVWKRRNRCSSFFLLIPIAALSKRHNITFFSSVFICRSNTL